MRKMLTEHFIILLISMTMVCGKAQVDWFEETIEIQELDCNCMAEINNTKQKVQKKLELLEQQNNNLQNQFNTLQEQFSTLQGQLSKLLETSNAHEACFEDLGSTNCTGSESGLVGIVEAVRVDGGWGSYSEWSQCSATCGGGVQFRNRTCNNPSPQNGGKPCTGDGVQQRVCNAGECCPEGWSPHGGQCKGMKPRQQNISDLGYRPDCGAGWYDVQGQGVKNDYCRWVGNCGCRNSNGGDCSYWSCALAGSNKPHSLKGKYTEPGRKPRQQNISDLGYRPNCGAGWYDVQRQGVKNDYCRWVGNCGCRNSNGGDCSRWSCALAGSNKPHSLKGKYTEPGTKPRQQNLADLGYRPDCGSGWYDVQGQGVKNDYCRWVGNCGCRNSNGGDCSWWSCALAGSNKPYSPKGKYTEPL